VKGRVGGQVVSRAVVVVTGVTATGEREVLGCAVGDTECEDFWVEFFRSLRSRGLRDVRLVISTPTRVSRQRSPKARAGRSPSCPAKGAGRVTEPTFPPK
jgi:putative transposase